MIDERFRTYRASAHDMPLPDHSVHTVITSPPYYGLRAYAGEQDVAWPEVSYRPMPGLEPITIPGCHPACDHDWEDARPRSGEGRRADADGYGRHGSLPPHAMSNRQGRFCARCGGWLGSLGMEPGVDAYVGHLILCLREWRRVLRKDGICWVNLGDSYVNANGSDNGVKAKDLYLVPYRFALAAQADGWWVRADITWVKGVSLLPEWSGSVMPDSTQDRPTKSTENIYMLTQQPHYFYDQLAVAEAAVSGYQPRNGAGVPEGEWDGRGIQRHRAATTMGSESGKRNLRSAWAVTPRGFSGAHFATFPEKLVEPMVKAATSNYGVCAECGAPWRRLVDRRSVSRNELSPDDPNYRPRRYSRKAGGDNTYANGGAQRFSFVNSLGWEPTCDHASGEPVPASVLDPFSGSGTTGKVALRMGRAYIGVDISETYLNEVTPKRVGDGVQLEMTT